ncbi:MAG: FTR1 family protein [Pseudomonadota bacterium]|nr:FTR1 family protein [Pseudomonadota bacterium]
MSKNLFSWILLLFLSLVLGSQASATASSDSEQGRLIVHILDYIAKDYGGAVQDKKILNQFEYDEQIEFVKAAKESVLALKIAPNLKKEVLDRVTSLALKIENLEDEKSVSTLAFDTKALAVKIFALPIIPASAPDLANGARIFAEKCASCHGASGDGSGAAGAGLIPKPSNFLDENTMEFATPFSAFNSIRLGITGTGMQGFKDLSDQNVWDLSYYVVSVRFAGADSSYKWLAMATWYLSQAESYYQLGDAHSAKAMAIKAYLEGIEPVEPKIKATDPNLVAEIEDAMNQVRGSIKNADSKELVSKKTLLAKEVIVKIQKSFSDQELTPGMAFASSLAILVREGFEAVLIVLALLSILQAVGAKRAYIWVHLGWGAALVCGLGLWWLTGTIIDLGGVGRESMEAIASLLAVVILLYVGFWLHSQTEIHRWKAFIHKRTKTIMEQKNLIGIALISFLGVFREAFETVLFLRALWLEGNESARASIVGGVATAFVVVLGLSWILFKMSRKLPIKKLFLVTSSVIAVLSVALAGKCLHAFQETGMVSVTVLPFSFRFEILGIFPTYETMAGQLLVALLIVVLWLLGNRVPDPIKVK